MPSVIKAWSRAVPGVSLMALWCLVTFTAAAEQRYQVTGMLLEANPAHHDMVVSCKEIPGYMEPMVMSFSIHGNDTLDSLKPGQEIEFTMVVKKNSTDAENVHLHPFESLELDPTEAARMNLLERLATRKGNDLHVVGTAVPDVTLVDQMSRSINLAQFSGKVVAVSFVYTRCPKPEYCFRLSNNFGRLQKQFKSRLGRDLVLLSIVIDPAHDHPEALAKYARIWKADPQSWYFLTGPLPDIRRVCDGFDVSFYPDEALLLHSYRTAIINREGKIAAVIDGNYYAFKELADLVESVMHRPN